MINHKWLNKWMIKIARGLVLFIIMLTMGVNWECGLQIYRKVVQKVKMYVCV